MKMVVWRLAPVGNSSCSANCKSGCEATITTCDGYCTACDNVGAYCNHTGGGQTFISCSN